MSALETYYEILSVVEDVTGISAQEILSSNCEENVDARHILVYALSVRGFSDTQISRLTKLTRPGVCIIRNGFKHRVQRYFVNLHFREVCQRVFPDKKSIMV